jgi:hypothetical protein
MTSDDLQSALSTFISSLRAQSGSVTIDEALSIAGKLQLGGSASQLIEDALNNHLVEKVIDYPPENWDSFEKPIWYVRPTSAEVAESYRNLPPHEWALLKLLWNQNDRNHLGQMKLEAAQEELRRQGFPERRLRVLVIEGVVGHFFTTEDGVMTEWCYVLPEWEKTEEYKRSEEEILRQAQEKAEMKMHFVHIDEIESDITRLLLDKPRGMSLEQIRKQLPDSYSARDVREALKQAIAFGYVKESKGTKGVRYQAVRSDEDD